MGPYYDFPGIIDYFVKTAISEHAGWAEGSCVTFRRIHEAVLRVIVSPPAGAPALGLHWRSGYQPLSLVPDPGAVVCIAKRFLKKGDRRR